ARAGRLSALVASGRAELILLRRMPGADAAEVAAAIAREAGLGLLAFDGSEAAPAPVDPEATEAPADPRAPLLDPALARRAGALALLSGAALLLERDAAPSETIALPPPLPAGLPTFLALGREGGVAPARLVRAATLDLPFPGPALRARIWREALGDRPVSDPAALRDRFQLPHGHIRRLAAAAVAETRLAGRETLTPEDVRRAARGLGRQELDGLADPLEARGRWDDLVASPAATALLRELAARARHREALPDRLSERPGRGLRALLTGPSGAGKTLAARIFAAELGMDIHRVDLASVVSKFVGETEKNLHRLLTRAEALDVVLLIDEGDALLARRTEVRSSNDRFANMETDFLLQRLEFHQGVVLVTTNLAESVDPAFQRRMDAVIPFARPGPEERRRIWDLHLPAGAEVDGRALDRLALRCALTGGQIRNAVRHAASRALEDGAPLAARHLAEGVAREYQKAGAVAPMAGLAEAPPDPAGARCAGSGRLSGFAAALAGARGGSAR
ncbi:MAG: ATP-binding protein, partial [Pseudomonadota bacterium]|nr:ATP-binding protein [Pseudomonadota bacterium]